MARMGMAIAALLLVTAGQAADAPMDPKRLVAGLYAAITAQNYDNMAKYLLTDYKDNNPSPGQGAGANGAERAYAELYKSFPDLRMQVQQVIAEGDTVAARVFMVGTHKGPWMGIAATGKQFRITGVDMFKVKNGQIAERWGSFDYLTLQQQLAGKK